MIRIIQLFVLITIITLGVQSAQAFDNSNGPELPAQCGSIVVPEGNKLAFHAYAKGVQIYKWNVVTQTWDLFGPQASLFAEEGYYGEIGNPSVGPTWQTKSGRKVEGRRVQGSGCPPDETALAWLLPAKFRTD